MKILCLRISGFGKFHDEKISFEDGLNLIQGDNESGKSTIHAFIRAMLFGAERKPGKASKDDFYSRYEPWTAPSDFRGSMDFEHEGRTYRLTRSLYKNDKSVSLTDLDSGTAIPLPTGTITSLIPELTENAFRNTVSSEQLGMKPSDTLADQVQDYIANLSLAKSKEVNVSGAKTELESIKKTLEKQLKGLRARKAALEEDVRTLEERIASDAEIKARMKQLSEDGEAARKDFDIARWLLKENRALDPSAVLAERGIERPTEPTEEEKDQLKARTALSAEVKSRELHKERLEELNREKDRLEKEIKRHTAPNNIITLVAFGMVILTAVILAVGLWTDNYLTLRSLAVGIAAVVCWIISVVSDKKLERENEKLDTVNDAIFDEETDQIHTTAKLRLLFQANQEEELRLQMADYYRELNGVAEKIRYDQECAQAVYDLAAEKLHGNELEIAELKGEIDDASDAENLLSEKKNELAEVESIIIQTEEKVRALDLSLSSIAGLSEEIRKSFGKNLNRRLSEITELITAGVYSDVRTDNGMNVEVMGAVDYIPIEKLSVGTIEQLRLALRLTVAELFFDDCQIPLLLDESFAYCDDRRLSEIMKFVAGLSGQVLMFSCSSRERRMCEAAGIKINLIEL